MGCALVAAIACGDDGPGAVDASARDGGGVDAGTHADGGGDAGVTVHPQILAFLRADAASNLLIEVDAADGAGPSDAVLDAFGSVIDSVADKPEGVRWQRDEVLPSHAEMPWTFGELQSLAASRASLDPGAGVRLHLLYVDGEYMNRNVLGIVVSTDAIVMFRDTLRRVCERAILSPLMRESLCETAEISVLTHEFGHVIGLVNAGLPMVADHEDPEHPKHDRDPDCVMYFAYEGETGVENLLGGLLGGERSGPLTYCDASLADIRAAQR